MERQNSSIAKAAVVKLALKLYSYNIYLNFEKSDVVYQIKNMLSPGYHSHTHTVLFVNVHMLLCMFNISPGAPACSFLSYFIRKGGF